jgi:hypothetical protein
MSEKKDDLTVEKKFLHDISTPLSVALYQVDFCLKQASIKADAAMNDRLQKAKSSVEKIIELLEEHRNSISD